MVDLSRSRYAARICDAVRSLARLNTARAMGPGGGDAVANLSGRTATSLPISGTPCYKSLLL